MMLKKLELTGFKSFAKHSTLFFDTPITAIVGPNGSGKSNTVEALRFVLGEQSQKSLRSKSGADLVFKGSKGRGQAKEASVLLSFDNTNRVCAITGDDGRAIPIDTDIVTIGRTVSIDGVNEYAINGNAVRLRDIHDMIARLNIGSSGHHIISQGEADRLLYAKPRDRKDMLEESLGLRLFQYRLKEARKKLDRTRDLVGEVEISKREITPQLRFLKKQVEKIEQAESNAKELRTVWEYYQRGTEASWKEEESKSQSELNSIREKLSRVVDQGKVTHPEQVEIGELRAREKEIEHAVTVLESEISQLERSIGRTEGALEMLSPKESPEEVSDSVTVSRKDVQHILDEIKSVQKSFGGESMNLETYLATISSLLEKLEKMVGSGTKAAVAVDASREEELRKTLESLLLEKKSRDEKKNGLLQGIAHVRQSIREKEALVHEADKKHQALMFEQTSLRQQEETLTRLLSRIEEERGMLQFDTNRVSQITSFVPLQAEMVPLPQEFATLVDARRYAERLIARIEDSGAGGGGDVIKEFETLSERDTFLDRELEDLRKAEADLIALESELRLTIETSFQSGIERINDAFSELFKAMFGGGEARLVLVSSHTDSEETEGGSEEEVQGVKPEIMFDGVEIDVKLPRKKVTDIEMLSGGERSLTSIALLFALSAVNPPPFLVLDETDAALDEANSKKYGDMIERLSEKTQLIVVTHNRETMSRAQTLYGVTLGTDDSSMLLTVKFDEAVKVAK
jgi:chromosome segregation protein